jgi:hypothetical protein
MVTAMVDLMVRFVYCLFFDAVNKYVDYITSSGRITDEYSVLRIFFFHLRYFLSHTILNT